MTSFTQKRDFASSEIIGLILFLLLIVTIQIIIVSKFPMFGLPLLIFFSFLAIILIINKNYIQDLPTVLFIVFLIPLVYLNNLFHYDFRLELLSSIPLILLILFAVATYLYYGGSRNSVKLYIPVPLFLMVLYFMISGVAGIAAGKNFLQVIYQIFQFSLYLMIFPLLYLIREKRHYLITFYFLLLVVLISSIEYILFNVVIYGDRFVTFQSGFFPVATAILLSYFLYQKEPLKKILAVLLLLIVISGTIITLTRSLWFITFFVILLVTFLYFYSNRKMTFVKVLFFLLIAGIPFLAIKDTGKNIQTNNREIESVKYRTESVSNPLEDASLLMRLELAYYAVERFFESPIVGKGLGDFLKYRIFVDTSLPIYYTDSTWLFLLWKGGIIGFFLFLWLFMRFLKVAYYNFISSTEIFTKALNLGLFVGMIGLIILGILSPILVKYKTNALIAFIFAYVEFERSKIKNEN